MRRAALPVCVACAALVVAGCGGSGDHARKHAGAKTATAPSPVSASVIAKAAAHSAAQPGYAVTLGVGVDSSTIDGGVSAAGSGVFDSRAGSVKLGLTLPGLFALLGAIQTQVIFSGDEAYAQVPASLRGKLPGVRPWVSESIDSFGRSLGLPAALLRGALTPRTLLQALAADSRGRADQLGAAVIDGDQATQYREALPQLGTGNTASVWIDPRTDLVRRVRLAYSSRGGAVHADAELTFDGYGAQTVPAPPAPSQVGTLSQALKALRL